MNDTSSARGNRSPARPGPGPSERVEQILATVMADVTGEAAGVTDHMLIRQTWSAVPPELTAQLAIGARIFDSRLAGLLFTGSPQRYVDASEVLRSRRHRAFARSSIPLLRTIATALHRFGASSWWADPGHQTRTGFPLTRETSEADG